MPSTSRATCARQGWRAFVASAGGALERALGAAGATHLPLPLDHAGQWAPLAQCGPAAARDPRNIASPWSTPTRLAPPGAPRAQHGSRVPSSSPPAMRCRRRRARPAPAQDRYPRRARGRRLGLPRRRACRPQARRPPAAAGGAALDRPRRVRPRAGARPPRRRSCRALRDSPWHPHRCPARPPRAGPRAPSS